MRGDGAPERGERVRPWPAGVVFDLDGTLADSFAAIAASLNRALVAAGLAPRDRAWVERHVGRGAVALVADALGTGAVHARVEEIVADYLADYGATFLEATPPLPGALAVVGHVARVTGGRVGVLSNKLAAFSRRWIERWGFGPHVAVVSGPDASGARKPDPAATRPILAALGVDAADALMVGDMDVDVRTARAVGMPAVAVRGAASTRAELGAAGAVAVLGAIGELPAWLAAHGRGWTEPLEGAPPRG